MSPKRKFTDVARIGFVTTSIGILRQVCLGQSKNQVKHDAFETLRVNLEMFWQTKGGWKTLWVMLEPLNIFEPSLRPRFVSAWWTWSSGTTSSSQPTTQRCSKFTCQKILVHKDDSTSYPKVMSGFHLLTLFMVFIPTFKHMGNVSKWGVLYSPESNYFRTTKGHFILKHAHSYII